MSSSATLPPPPVGNADYALVNGSDVDAYVLMLAAFFAGIIMFVISIVWVGGVCIFRFCCGCCGGRRRKRDTFNYSQKSKLAWRIIDILIGLGLFAAGLAGLAGMAAIRQEAPGFLNALKQFSTTAAGVTPVARQAEANNEALVSLRQKAVELSGTLAGLFPNTDDIKNNEFYGYGIIAITVIAAVFFVTSMVGGLMGIATGLVPRPWLARGMVVACMVFLAWHFLVFAFFAPVNTVTTTVCKLPGWFQSSENMKRTYLAQQITTCENSGKWAPVFFKPGDNQPRMTADEVSTYLKGTQFESFPGKPGTNLTNFYVGVDVSVRGELDTFYKVALDNVEGVRAFEAKLKEYLGKQPGRLGQVGKDLDLSTFTARVREFADSVKRYGDDYAATCRASAAPAASQAASGTAIPAVRPIDWGVISRVGGDPSVASSTVYDFEDTLNTLKCSASPTLVIDLFRNGHVSDTWNFRRTEVQAKLRQLDQQATEAGANQQQIAARRADLERQLETADGFLAMMETFEAKKFGAATRLVALMFGAEGSLSCDQVRTLWTNGIKGALCGKAVLGGVQVVWGAFLVCGIFGFLAVTLGLISVNRFVVANLATVVPSFEDPDEEAPPGKDPNYATYGAGGPEPLLPPASVSAGGFASPPPASWGQGEVTPGGYGANEPVLPRVDGDEPGLPGPGPPNYGSPV